MTPITLTLALRIVSEANRRGHWAKGARRAAEQRALSRMALQGRLPGPPLPALLVVALTRVAPRELDGDNLQRALKAVRDGVADALGINDRDPRISWQYGQARGEPQRYAVIVDVRDPQATPESRPLPP